MSLEIGGNMAKKDIAFELFNQGKERDAPEVIALGLKKETIRKYYGAWVKINVKLVPEPESEPEAVPSKILLGSMDNDALFEFKGQVYRKQNQIYSGQVIVLLMNKASYTTIYTSMGESTYLSPNAEVKPL